MHERFDNSGFKATARNLTQPILLTDADGKVTWANRAFVNLCGYSLKEMRGQRPGDFLQGKLTDPHMIKAMHKAIQKHEPFSAEILNYHKKGHIYWADISVTPFFDKDGQLEGHLGIAHDRTSHRLEVNRMEKNVVSVYTALLAKEYEAPSTDVFESDPFLSKLEFSEN